MGFSSLATRAPCRQAAARLRRSNRDRSPQPLPARNQKRGHKGPVFDFWRRGWDSNPRYGRTVHLISSQAHSTTLAPLLSSACSVGKMPCGHRTPDWTRRFVRASVAQLRCARCESGPLTTGVLPAALRAPAASKIAPGELVGHCGTLPMLHCGVGILRRCCKL